MNTLIDVDVTPLPKRGRKTAPAPEPEWTPETDTLFDGEYTGRTVTVKGKLIYVGRLFQCTLTSECRYYVVSVDGRLKWAPEEWVCGWFDL